MMKHHDQLINTMAADVVPPCKGDKESERETADRPPAGQKRHWAA